MSGGGRPDSRRGGSTHGSIPHHEREEALAVTRSAVHPEVRQVVDALIAALGDDLKAILWHGSFARGEAKPDSDHDLIVVLKRIDDDVLLRLREIFRGRPNWSTFVRSEEELRQFPPTERLQFHFGLVPLYGDLQPPPVTRDNILADLRALARDISFECRYRLLHGTARDYPRDERFADFVRVRNARILYYYAKLALVAMKARELLAGRPYPLTRRDLRQRLTDPDDIAIVDTVERWPELRPQYENDFAPLALQLDAFARRLVASLETGDKKHETRRRGGARVSSRVSRVSKGEERR